VAAEFAAKLRDALSGAEVLGTTAPDELAVLFPSSDATSAQICLAAALGDGPFDVDLPAGRRVSVEWAAGVAGFPEHATTGDELYMATDSALAEAVDGGQPVSTAR
jgi:two-component system cell cycle response regulator